MARQFSEDVWMCLILDVDVPGWLRGLVVGSDVFAQECAHPCTASGIGTKVGVRQRGEL